MTQDDDDAGKLLRTKRVAFAIGLEKCGTTSLNNLLALAANVSSPWPKELQYFSSQYEKGAAWFLGHHDKSKEILVDFSPNYHRSQDALERIKADCPKKAIMLLLRHPIERALSAYTHIRYWFFERDMQNGTGGRAHAKAFSELIGGVKPFLFPSYTRLIEQAVSVFGRSIVSVIPLEYLLRDPWSLLGPVEKILDCSIELDHTTKIPRSNALYMPQFFTGRQILDRQPDATDLITDIEATYIVRGGMPRRIGEAGLFTNLKLMEAKWLQPLTASAASRAFNRYYGAETTQIETMLGISLDAWRVFKEYRPRTIQPLSLEAARENADVGLWYVRHLFSKKKMPEQAVAFLRELLANQPTQVQFHSLMADILFETGDLYGADRHSTIAARLAPQDPRFAAFRSKIGSELAAQQSVNSLPMGTKS